MTAAETLQEHPNPKRPTPQAMARFLLASGLAEDDALDLMRVAGERWGWTKELDLCGLYYLKPHALDLSPEEARKA